ncbi:MAG TPA: phosphatase PAP2 family protein [Bradyrhizobium sp.]|nr:phosphatase PAP2 family protein [Bradyrhizobium sp.]
MQGVDRDMDIRLIENNRIIWSVVALLMMANFFGYRAAGLGIDFHGSFKAFFIIPAVYAVSLYYRYRRPDPWIARGVEGCAQAMSILLLGMMLTYPLATLDFPYRDSQLHAADVWMGIDWQAYLEFFNTRPILGLLSKAAYCSMQLQYPLVILALTASSRFLRLQQYILAIAIALLITLLIFTFVPAVGAYAYLGIPPEHYSNLGPIVLFEQMRHLEAMRTGSWSVISNMEGLISFPSFHTISAILFTWAIFPLRRLRWWTLGLNSALIASTPIQGAHYFIDVVGGLLVATIAIFGARLLARDREVSAADQRFVPRRQAGLPG